MMSKQMEEIQRKLGKLNYPRADGPAHSLLFPGSDRYDLLEWLFSKLMHDKLPFSHQNLSGAAMVRDEETNRIQYLAEIAKLLGFSTTIDAEAIQGRGSIEDRAEMLSLIVDLVEVSICADNHEWSIDDQVVKDVQLIDFIAEKQALIFSEECKLFPADVQILSIFPLPGLSVLQEKLSEQSTVLSNLQHDIDDLASKLAYNPEEEFLEVESRLRVHMKSFLESSRSFHVIYTKEIRPWTQKMEVPQLNGFGSAACHLLEAYNMVLTFLMNLRNVRDSYAALSIGSSESEPSSVAEMIADYESALECINHDLRVLSSSIAREHGHKLDSKDKLFV